MKFNLLLVVLCVSGLQAAKTTKKAQSATVEKKSPKSAIIAIQILDPEDEKTGGKNSKRTIDSALGYGFQGGAFGKQQPRYQVYKYSQNDIPPYRGPPFRGHSKIEHDKIEFHKPSNLQYNFKSSVESANQYRPGTTLFSTINLNGQVGGLSTHVPQPLESQENLPIPVIILRVLPSQLAGSSNHLYPNLPQSNNFAPIINALDIKSLLASYIQRNPIFHQMQQSYQSQSYQPEYRYMPSIPQQNPAGRGNYETYQNDYQYEVPSRVPHYDKVSYRQQQGSQQTEEQESHRPRYQYLQDEEQTRTLLTHENYPSEKHTRVVFKTSDGQIRNSQTQSDYELPQQSQSQGTEQNIDYSQYDDYNEQDSDDNRYVYENSQDKGRENQKLIYVSIPSNRET